MLTAATHTKLNKHSNRLVMSLLVWVKGVHNAYLLLLWTLKMNNKQALRK
jgi:hypothetical protein